MLPAASIKFLRELDQNNERDWFKANKQRYELDLKEPWESFVTKLISDIKKYNPNLELDPKDAIFRIYRDVRFSKDKTPYKTHVSAVIAPNGRKVTNHPAFYLHLEPGRFMIGGGIYHLDRQHLYQVRKFISLHLEEFQGLIHDSDFVKRFGQIEGKKNKVLPKEFRPAAQLEPLLYNKQFYYSAEMPPETALRPNILKFARKHYLTARPLHIFFQQALLA